MEMTVETRPDGVAIITMVGKLDLLSTAAVKQQLTQTVHDGTPRLVIELSQVGFIDSSGLAALISGLKTARMAGGDVYLVCPGVEVRNILEFTRLDRVLQMYDSLEAALAAYGA